MKRYIDLTRTIVDEQAVYPGDDATSLKRSGIFLSTVSTTTGSKSRCTRELT
jgi:kynurenine formamidase